MEYTELLERHYWCAVINSLFTIIAYHSGDQFSYESLSNESGVKKETLKKYINYLEAAFLIKVDKENGWHGKKVRQRNPV